MRKLEIIIDYAVAAIAIASISYFVVGLATLIGLMLLP